MREESSFLHANYITAKGLVFFNVILANVTYFCQKSWIAESSNFFAAIVPSLGRHAAGLDRFRLALVSPLLFAIINTKALSCFLFAVKGSQ